MNLTKKKILLIKAAIILFIFLAITVPVSANEIIKFNQFNNYLRQAIVLSAYGKHQEAQGVLRLAKESINTTIFIRVLKSWEIDRTEKEINKINKFVVESITIPTPIPTLTPTPIQQKPSIPAPTPIPTSVAKSSYVYDPYYPIILSLSDNKGGQTKYSSNNQHPYSSANVGVTLKAGDTIKWKAEASDPKGRQILYSFTSNSQRFTDLFGRENGNCKYKPTSSEVEFAITREDLKEIGETMRVVLYVRSEKDNYRTGGECGYDDSTYLDYKLQPN